MPINSIYGVAVDSGGVILEGVRACGREKTNKHNMESLKTEGEKGDGGKKRARARHR